MIYLKDAAPVHSIEAGNMEIVIDDDIQDKIELYILDAHGNRVEGGTFDKNAFMDCVRTFYNDNY
jgi:hypothetical protein